MPPVALGLRANDINQRAQHILFLELDFNLATDATPAVTINGEDVSDLAGNRNGDDHLVGANDGLAPVFTVSVGKKLSNDTLDVSIETSEGLNRRPTARITLGEGDTALTRTLDVDDETPSTWSVSEDRSTLGLTARNGTQDGVWNIRITGIDEAGNSAEASVATWELDTRANGGVDPVRGGAKLATDKLEVETQAVIFLSLTFENEIDEYDGGKRGKDSAKTIAVTAVTLETLDADGNVVADSAKELDAGVVQTADGQRFVIALTEDEEGNPVAKIGSYQLALDYSDTAGNTDDYDFKFKVIAQVKAKIDISPGWNLISIPGGPKTKAIGDVLDKSAVTEVWGFNNDSKRWEFARKNDDGSWVSPVLSQLVDGRAYFVRSTTFDPDRGSHLAV